MWGLGNIFIIIFALLTLEAGAADGPVGVGWISVEAARLLGAGLWVGLRHSHRRPPQNNFKGLPPAGRHFPKCDSSMTVSSTVPGWQKDPKTPASTPNSPKSLSYPVKSPYSKLRM